MDMSFMGKLLVQGRDAEQALNQLCCNDLSVPSGRIVYTQWVNEIGGIEADLTVTRLAEDRFLVVCSDTAQGHVQMWLDRHVPRELHVFVTDVTSSYAQLNLHGPRSRELLAELTSSNINNDAFPYLHGQHIDIDYAQVLAIRVTYVGELGWELYIPTEHAVQVYDRIVAVGSRYRQHRYAPGGRTRVCGQVG